MTCWKVENKQKKRPGLAHLKNMKINLKGWECQKLFEMNLGRTLLRSEGHKQRLHITIILGRYLLAIFNSHISRISRGAILPRYGRTYLQSYSWVSVIRFVEISPLGQTFKNIWQIFQGLVSVWQNFEPTNYKFWANLMHRKKANNEK